MVSMTRAEDCGVFEDKQAVVSEGGRWWVAWSVLRHGIAVELDNYRTWWDRTELNRIELNGAEQTRTDRSTTMPEKGDERCQCSYKNHSQGVCHSAGVDSAYLLGLGDLTDGTESESGRRFEVWAGVIRMPVARCRGGMYRAEGTVEGATATVT